MRGAGSGAGAFWYENEMVPLDFEFENLRKASVVTCNYVFNSFFNDFIKVSHLGVYADVISTLSTVRPC